MNGQLESEIEALRERLEEAEELRRAITSGEVDAFVVGPSDEDKKVLLLAGAYSRYRQLVDELQYGTVTLGAGGEILFANEGFARIIGAALPGLHNAALADYVHPEDRAAVSALLTTPGKDSVTLRLLRRDGAQLRAKITIVSTWEGYVTLVVTDLSQDGLAEEAQSTLEAIRRGEVDAFMIGDAVVTLSTARDPYRILADRIQQGALTLSPEGRILYANARLARMLNVPGDRLLGTALETYAVPAERTALAELLSPLKRSSQGEVRLRRADGESIHTLVSVATLADRQRMCLVTDLSDAKRHQASDERTRKFLGTLAHEFRNILSPIRNSVDYLQRQENLSEECRKMVEVVDRQSTRLLALVEDLRRVNPKE